MVNDDAIAAHRAYPDRFVVFATLPMLDPDRAVHDLSVGERQRVALARAFVRDAPLLLLDEPTANLDGATEHEILEALRGLMRGRTVVIVAHRPALVELADRVVELGRSTVTA